MKVDERGGGEWGQMEVDGAGWDEGGQGRVQVEAEVGDRVSRMGVGGC